MSLPTSGTISASMIQKELKESGSWSINSPSSRKLAKVPSGTIKFTDFYGKSMESPMDFWIEGRLSFDSDQGNFIEWWGTIFTPTKVPSFLKPEEIVNYVMAGWAGDASGTVDWYYEQLSFINPEFFQFNSMTRTIYDINGIEIPDHNKEEVFKGGVANVSEQDTRKALIFYTDGSTTSPIFNIFTADTHAGDYKDLKIHIKLSNSL